jgi:hypothetical protein
MVMINIFNNIMVHLISIKLLILLLKPLMISLKFEQKLQVMLKPTNNLSKNKHKEQLNNGMMSNSLEKNRMF